MESINKLNRAKDIPKLYDYLFQYETKFASMAGMFDIDDQNLKDFLKSKNIYLGALNKKQKGKSKNATWFILYSQRIDDKVSKADKVHHLLRHIRNSIAHCLIRKRKGEIFMLEDKRPTTGENTMEGRIKVDLFYELLEVLVNSKKII